MTKFDYGRTNKSTTAFLNDPYWTKPKSGFDKNWHEQAKHQNNRLQKEVDLGIHKDHQWEPVKIDTGPHVGKLICVTCNNKFIRWLPKWYFNSNT